MIEIYYAHCGILPADWRIVAKSGLLSPRGTERVGLCLSERKKPLIVISDLLLTYSLSRYGASIKQITRSSHGKPFIHGGVYFNLSHSEQVACCAVSDRNVGIDVEYKENRDIKSAESFFSAKDYKYITDSKLDASEKIFRFYDIWTKYESFLKCIGSGWIKKEAVVFENDRRDSIHYGKHRFNIASPALSEGYAMSVCTESDDLFQPNIKLTEVTTSALLANRRREHF